jgi:TRAP-type C4-dicarboxylate transport system substrate-binding protein
MTTMRRALLLALLLAMAPVHAAVLKVATSLPEGSGWMKVMRGCAAAIKERSDGRVELKFYPGGVMGNDAAVLRKIKLGQLQAAAFTGAEASLVYSSAPLYSLPFLFQGEAEVAFVRSRVDAQLLAGFEEHGMVAAGIGGGGFVYLMSTQPIRTRNELKVRKVWVPPSDRIAQVAYEAGGVSPISLPLTDVYPGLQTGLIDTVANTAAGSIFFQWHTKVKYVVDLPLTYVVGVMLIDKKAFERVDEADRALVREEVGKAFAAIDANLQKENDAARATLVKNGIEFIKPSEQEAEFWRGIGRDAQARLVEQGAISAELLNAVRAAQAEYRAAQGQGGAR